MDAALKREWLVVAAGSAIVAGLLTADFLMFPEENARGKPTPLSIVAMIGAAVLQATWISMDRRRRGRDAGWWRFAVILFGPFAMAIYLILEYRLRSLLLIPLMVGIYAAVCLLPWGIALAVYYSRA